jgi:hypothetical protein
VPRIRYVSTLLASAALILPAGAIALPALSANPANKMLKRGIDPLRYDRATHCTGHNTKGAEALAAWLEHNSAGVTWGIYRCEKWGKHEASLHAEGRAIDWHLDAGDPAQKRAAYKLIELLLAPDKAGNQVALARRMGVQGLIFNCESWWGSPDGELGKYSYCFDKKGKRKKAIDRTQAHMDHIHIELNKLGAAKKTTFWNAKTKYPLADPEQPATSNPWDDPVAADPEPDPWTDEAGGAAETPTVSPSGGFDSHWR